MRTMCTQKVRDEEPTRCLVLFHTTDTISTAWSYVPSVSFEIHGLVLVLVSFQEALTHSQPRIAICVFTDLDKGHHTYQVPRSDGPIVDIVGTGGDGQERHALGERDGLIIY